MSDVVGRSGLRSFGSVGPVAFARLPALGVSPSLRLVHNGRLQPRAEVRKAWEQHGKHDSYSTVNETRALDGDILPGSIVRRHLLWRYSLVYHKPVDQNGPE